MNTASNSSSTQHVRTFGLLLLLLALTLPASRVAAQCKQWDVSGEWVLQQRDGYAVTLTLTQRGTAFSGKATHDVLATVEEGEGSSFGAANYGHGTAEGTIEGDDFYMNISWGSKNDTHGIYRGKITAQGRLEGTMYHKEIPKNKSKWFSTRAMKCADAPAAAPVPNPRPLDTRPPKPTGKAPVTRPTPAASTPAETPRPSRRPLRPPFIVANPPVVTVRAQQSVGTTTLVWDAGVDHPYAEVWVKVNGGAEQRIVEQGKGTREVTVEPGKSYIYILTDAGEQLGTVGVQAQRVGR